MKAFRFTIIIALVLCLFSSLPAQEEFKPNAGFIIGFGGRNLDNARVETALGVEVAPKMVIQGHLGSSKEGESRVGFGAAYRFFETETTTLYLMGSWNPEEEIGLDSLLSDQTWNLKKALWGAAIYHKPSHLGGYARRNDDLTEAASDHWEFFIFYWANVEMEWPF